MSAEQTPLEPLPRSKLDLLYRDILAEGHQIAGRMEAVVQQLAAVSQSCAAVPAAIRQASVLAQDDVTANAVRALQGAMRDLKLAEQDVKIAARAAAGAARRRIWLAIGLGTLCGLMGGLVGGLLALAALS